MSYWSFGFDGISFCSREFIESDLVAFAKQNPHVAIYLKPRRHRAPVIVAEYCEFRNRVSLCLKSYEGFSTHPTT